MIITEKNGSPRIYIHKCDNNQYGLPINRKNFNEFALSIFISSQKIDSYINKTVYKQNNKDFYILETKDCRFLLVPSMVKRDVLDEDIFLQYAKINFIDNKRISVIYLVFFSLSSEDLSLAVAGGKYFVKIE